MSSKRYPLIPVVEIRRLASDFDNATLKQCMELAIQGQPNPCYTQQDQVEMVNVLAKAGVVSDLMLKCYSLRGAMRELDRRMRAITVA
jgi:hypothetical protein